MIRGKRVKLPIFLPDATRAVVRSLDSCDLALSHTEAIVVNTFHLFSSPGVELLTKLGGVGELMNYRGLIVSDSGGFQIMSLFHQKKLSAKISRQGIEFKWRLKGEDKQILFTPELSIQTQFSINADIMVVLDYFTNPKANQRKQALSVEYTLEWAERSKVEFMRQVKKRKLTDANRPLLMGVIQGGEDKNLRKQCAQKLVKLDFDLYGYGGWPINEAGKFNQEIYKYNASLTPDNKPRFALGVGKPADIKLGVKYGYHFFDCVLPTRDARHGRLYLDDKHYLYISRLAYAGDFLPINSKCQCYTCKHYSRAYLHHLYKIKDSLYWRLSSIHNLYYYHSLIKKLRNYKLEEQ